MLSKTYTKYIQSLHHKKHRDKANRFIAEGEKVVMDLLRSGNFICEEVLGTAEWLKRHEPGIRNFFKGPIQVTEPFELEKISALNTPNQALAIFNKRTDPIPGLTGKITLALDSIQDPGNLGTIIRIADWFGIRDIICSQHTVEQYNPKVVQATMGSLGRVHMHYVELAEWLGQYKGVSTYAASLTGKNIKELGKISEGIFIIGNESKGISEHVMQLANEQVTITRVGEAESLNAAVATGIILSHIA